MFTILRRTCALFFFFNDTATTEIYTLSLHDALPISLLLRQIAHPDVRFRDGRVKLAIHLLVRPAVLLKILRSEEHTSELQSQSNLVCRLLLEKKNQDTRMREELTYLYTPTWLNCVHA